MAHYVGLDCSKRTTSICVVDDRGKIVEEGVAESRPDAISKFLRGGGRRYALVGTEASSPAWLCDGLTKRRFRLVRIESFHAHGVLRAQRNKTDRNDARGIAEIMRIGAFKEVQARSPESRRLRALLSGRSVLQDKLLEVEQALTTLLGEHGLELPKLPQATRATRLSALVKGRPYLDRLGHQFIHIASELSAGVAELDAVIVAEAAGDPVCRRLMTAPGVGPIVALTYRAAVDDPTRFSSSRDVAAHFGLTPRTYNSGLVERRGRISKRGDPTVRKALFLSARCVLRPSTRPSALKTWGLAIVQKSGWTKGAVAVARRLAVILHLMWLTETDFLWSQKGEAAQ
jgi:transposase